MDTILPRPSVHELTPSQPSEHAPLIESPSPSNEKGFEVVASPPERLSSANQAVVQAVGAKQIASQNPVAVSPPAITASQSPLVADDVPVIEKEWVLLAKEVIARTRQDPRQQTTELGSVKKDYVLKRFGKDIKVTEDA